MKTQTQLKFDRIVKDGFHILLKPLDFKKKANNFYRKLDEVGQIVNIQKSTSSTKDNISFTINIGIFVPEYWNAVYNRTNLTLPEYPTEPECLLRMRIGQLRNQSDIWYTVDGRTTEQSLIAEMNGDVNDYILPLLDKNATLENVLNNLQTENPDGTSFYKMLIYSERHKIDKAREEYQNLLKIKTKPNTASVIKEYAREYGLL